MELFQLEYFLEAARQRNFTRAAARLNLAQAALSEQIRKLETELGTTLFSRGRRETVLTAAGETLLPHAESMLAKAEEAKNAVQEMVGLRGGRLNMGVIPSVSECLLPKTVAPFRKLHPKVELGLMEGTSEEVALWVEQGRVEFGIVQLPASAGRFDEQLLFSEPFVVVVAKSHAVAKQRHVSLAKLSQESFILYKGRVRDTALAACRDAGFEPRIACESGGLETIRLLVAAGLGIAILPQLATRELSSKCKAISILGGHVERQVAILSRHDHTLSTSAQVFLEILKRHAERELSLQQ